MVVAGFGRAESLKVSAFAALSWPIFLAAAIAAGESVNYEGASGKLIFDDEGDRIGLGMRSFTVNSSNDGWDYADL